MQFDEFDKRLKQAADEHHPEYDEKAWSKMKRLLDHELPQKRDRRRGFIFFLFLFLLIGGGAWLLINKPWEKDKIAAESQQKLPSGNSNNGESPAVTPESSNKTGENESNTSNSQTDKKGNEPTTRNTDNNLSGNENPENASKIDNALTQSETINKKGNHITSGNNDLTVNVQNGAVGKKTKTSRNKASKSIDGNEVVSVTPGSRLKEKGKKDIKRDPGSGNRTDINDKANNDDATQVMDKSVAAGDNPKTVDHPVIVPVENNNQAQLVDAGNKISSDTPSSSDSSSVAKLNSKDDSTKQAEVKKVAKSSGNSKKPKFSFSVSAGPDISSVGMSNPGKIELVSGAGIGYTFKDRWTIRTGFYSARKIYDAKPGDYKPSTPILYPDYVKNIAGDCKVYEIPLTIAYTLGHSSRFRPFASLGLSSFIMKKEKYDYLYVYPGGTTYTYTHKESNKNKHYFSVLSLSGGYQYQLSKSFSLAAEPYLKIPLAGVGYGKVKLYSAGILFSAIVTPFK